VANLLREPNPIVHRAVDLRAAHWRGASVHQREVNHGVAVALVVRMDPTRCELA
jgi:hypothetical protein